MGWFEKIAKSDKERITDNIERLTKVRDRVKELSNFVLSSPGGAFDMLQKILELKVVKGREKVEKILRSALFGESRQNIALDSPRKFQDIMLQAVDRFNTEINSEKSKIQQLEKKENDGSHSPSKGLRD